MKKKGKSGIIDRIFRKLKIRQQIMGSMIFVCAASLILLGTIVFGISKKTIETNYRNAHEYNLQVSSRIIDIQFGRIIESVRTLLINDSFKNKLTEKNDSRYFSGSSEQVIRKAFASLESQYPVIIDMVALNENGNWMLFTKNSSTRIEMEHYYESDDMLEEDWVSVARKAKGKEVFYGYNVLTKSDKDNTVSLVKNMINPVNGKSMGFIAINIKKTLLDKAFGTKEKGYETNRYLIMEIEDHKKLEGSLGYTVYFNGNESEKEEIVTAFASKSESGKYLFSSYKNETCGWEVVNVIEKSELSHDSSYIGWIIIFVGIGLIILSVGLSQIISGQISRPLNTLAETISEVGEGNFKVEADFEDNEIGQIGNKFKTMVNNNLELRERLLNSEIKEREAELLLLQSQINPHFLYNTLDSLYFMAVIKNEDEIADMVMALSNTFKLSLNKGGKLIRVKDELEKMKAYMKIQEFRYHDRFEFRLNVQENILEEKILTFILQPIIENSMYHGLEAKVGGGYISVEGYREEKILHFILSDNGVGIDDLSKLDKGYGVSNVKERVKLFYGEAGQVEFTSKAGVGTTAHIAVPILPKEEEPSCID